MLQIKMRNVAPIGNPESMELQNTSFTTRHRTRDRKPDHNNYDPDDMDFSLN